MTALAEGPTCDLQRVVVVDLEAQEPGRAFSPEGQASFPGVVEGLREGA